MKKLVVGLSLSASLFMLSANAMEGKDIFEMKGCAVCHKLNNDTIGPALSTIKMAYLGKEKTLIPYLKGQGTSIVDPSRAAVMNPQLVKLKSLYEEDIKSLAEYIISANDRPAIFK